MDTKQHDESLSRLERSVGRLEALAEAQEKREEQQEKRLEECAKNTERIAVLEATHAERDKASAAATQKHLGRIAAVYSLLTGLIVLVASRLWDWLISQGGHHIK